MRRRRLPQLLTAALLASAGLATADTVTLRVPELAGGRHLFYASLLEESLRAAGHVARIQVVADMPQLRAWMALQTGGIDVFWGLQTRERDHQFASPSHDLTNGLISQRVLLVPQGDLERYAKVTNLADLKATGARAALGSGWFDARIWGANQLPFQEVDGSRLKIYALLSAKNRGLDYYPRGAHEIVEEAKFQPDLAIEPHLLLVYRRDFRYYLSTSAAKYRPLLEDALQQAERSGLKRKLIDSHFGPALASLRLDKRVRIELQTPPE